MRGISLIDIYHTLSTAKFLFNRCSKASNVLIFCYLQTNDNKFVKLADLEKIRLKLKNPSAETVEESVVQGPAPVPAPFEVLIAPDWLSLHEEDWTFFGPSTRHVHVHVQT